MQQLQKWNLAEYVSPKLIFGYTKPVTTKADLHNVKNVHRVFVTKEGLCDITCKVRAIKRLAEKYHLKPEEILYVDNSAPQTVIAEKTLACHAFTVVDQPTPPSSMSVEDMARIAGFVKNGCFKLVYAERDGNKITRPSMHLWFPTSGKKAIYKSLTANDPKKPERKMPGRKPAAEVLTQSQLANSTTSTRAVDGDPGRSINPTIFAERAKLKRKSELLDSTPSGILLKPTLVVKVTQSTTKGLQVASIGG